jgi:hypothetical protein
VRKRLGMVDLDTGEVLEGGVPVWFGARPRSPYGNRWVAMSQSFLEEFAARKDVRGETLRVFLYLNARLDFENMIHLPMIEVAEALAMRRQNVKDGQGRSLPAEPERRLERPRGEPAEASGAGGAVASAHGRPKAATGAWCALCAASGGALRAALAHPPLRLRGWHTPRQALPRAAS